MDSANEQVASLKRQLADAQAAAAEARAAAEEAEDELAALRAGEGDRLESLRWVLCYPQGGPTCRARVGRGGDG